MKKIDLFDVINTIFIAIVTLVCFYPLWYVIVISFSDAQGYYASQYHIIAIDRENGFIYASISNALVKSDMNGNVVGSIYNLPGHIGDIAFNPDDGRIYAAQYVYNGNGYISMIDGDDIAQVGMEYSEHKEILKSVYALSADGTAIGPDFGETDSDKKYLYITKNKGVYKQFLQYDIDELKEYETVWDGKHTNGPEGPRQRYYVHIGTTVYGIQNLEYDPYTEAMICCIYGVSGDIYPKYCTYMVDMTTLPEKGEISDTKSIGAITKFAPYGIYHEATGIWGAKFNKGSHGFASLGSVINNENGSLRINGTMVTEPWNNDIASFILIDDGVTNGKALTSGKFKMDIATNAGAFYDLKIVEHQDVVDDGEFTGDFYNGDSYISSYEKGDIYFNFPVAAIGSYNVVAALYEDNMMTELKTFEPLDLYAGKVKLFDTKNSTAEKSSIKVYLLDTSSTLNKVTQVWELK